MSARIVRPGAVVGPTAGAVLVLRYWPQPRQLQQELTHPHAWIAAVGADNAAATLAGALLWVAALWLCLGTSAAVLSLTPGRVGQVADLLARYALPSALRRVVIAVAGASILLAPVSAFAAPANTAPGNTAAPSWPTDGSATSVSAPSWPTDGATPDTAQRGHRTTTRAPDSAVTVRSGDSLWAIAGRQLGDSARPAQIAAVWPRWYATNRATVGADPNLLRPGMRLHAPPVAPSNTEE